MINAISVDLEDWYHICGAGEYSTPEHWHAYESRIVRNTERVLSLLRRYHTKATFFVLGYIASREPDLIKNIRQEGHEIATHGFYHKRIFEMTELEFENDLKLSIDAISSAAHENIIGFRAPEWSIRNSTLWVLDILRKNGILYDSSMVPLFRMGERTFPLYPKMLTTMHGDIWEFPLSTFRFFFERLPFSGGLPLRVVPYFYIYMQLHKLNAAGKPGIVYLHPWEFDSEQVKIDLPLTRRFMHYYNIQTAPKKIEGLLRHFKFGPIKEVLGITNG